MAIPGIACRFTTTNPPDVAVSTPPGWYDISKYVMSFHISRGKQRILDRFEPGTMDIVLKNTDRRFDPTNPSSPYPVLASDTTHTNGLIPLRMIQLGFVVNGVTSWVYTGLIERWPQIWKGPTWAEVDLTCVDFFEHLNNHYLSSSYATLAIVYNVTPVKELTYTAVQLGFVGNSTTVTHIVSGLNTALSVSVSGTDITVHIATDGGGSPTSTTTDVANLVNADTFASGLVTASVTGPATTVVAMAITNLSGGTFIQQLSGARIGAILDFVGWPATQRNIATGSHQCQAQSIAMDASTTALSFLQEVEQTELASLFIDRNGNVTFLDQSTLASTTYSTPAATFADAPGTGVGTFPYQNLQGDWDKDLIYNNIRSTRLNGVVQVANDSTSDNEYFTRSLDLSPLSISDTESLNLAEAYLTKFKEPYFRFEPMKLFPGTNTSMWANLVKRELMDTVSVIRYPPGGGVPILKSGRIIGIEITGSSAIQNTVWNIQIDPTSGTTAFILDDPVFGLLDQNSLGY